MTTSRFGPEFSQSRTYELVLDRLRDAIIGGVLRAGEPIRTAAIAAELGVSRMPVREALHRLEMEGLVARQPYRGAVVAPLSVDIIRDVYEVLAVVEGVATGGAAERITEEGCDALEHVLAQMDEALEHGDRDAYFRAGRGFHQDISNWHGNPVAHDVLSRLRYRVHRVGRMYAMPPQRLAQARLEHVAILGALRDHDRLRAEALAREHASRAGAALEEMIQAPSRDGEVSGDGQDVADGE